MYRVEIDALNALVAAQNRTNELLQQLLERGMENGLHSNAEGQDNNTAGNKRNVHGDHNQNGTVQPIKGTGKREPRGNA
jgi:hypothetical protein